jgi:hypothetical protein
VEPSFHVGTNLKKTVLLNIMVVWGMSSSKYVQADVQNLQEYLVSTPGGRKVLKKAYATFAMNYKPKVDDIRELSPAMATYFQLQIGILCGCVELGCIGIITEVSMLSSFLFLPHEGHLDAVFHVFANLQQHHNAIVVFDPNHY